MKSEPPSKKPPLIVSYVARVCLNAKDAEMALQDQVKDYSLTPEEESQVRMVMKETQAGLIQR